MTDVPTTSSFITTTEYPYVYWPFSLVSVFCFCVGVPTNFFSLTYFIKKNRNRPSYISILYILMNAVDLMICVFCFPKAMSSLSGGKELFFSVEFLCSAWGYLWQILIRLSVFSVGLMSIYRTISLSLPFVKLSKRHIFIPGIGYLVIQMVQQSIPWWFGQGYNYNGYFGICMWAVWFDFKSVEAKVMYIAFIFLPFILPLFPIVISCLISIVKLRKDSKTCESGPKNANNEFAVRAMRRKRAATITIVLLTVAYIVFNLPYCLWMLEILVNVLSEGKTSILQSWFNDSTPYYNEIYNFIFVFLIPLNSTINPLIYIFRLKVLRCYIWNLLSCRARASSPVQMLSMGTLVSKVGPKPRTSTSRGSRTRLF